MKSLPEALEKLQLGVIPDGVAGRVDAERQVETHDTAPRAQLRHRHALQLTALELGELLVRCCGSSRDFAKAEPSAHPRKPVLLAKAAEGVFRATATPIRRSFACSHDTNDPIRVSTGALPAIY